MSSVCHGRLVIFQLDHFCPNGSGHAVLALHLTGHKQHPPPLFTDQGGVCVRVWVGVGVGGGCLVTANDLDPPTHTHLQTKICL